jgi:hypothetical protein
MQTHPTFYVGLLKPYHRLDEPEGSATDDSDIPEIDLDGSGAAQTEPVRLETTAIHRASSETAHSVARWRSPRLREGRERVASSDPFEETAVAPESGTVGLFQPGQVADEGRAAPLMTSARPPATRSRSKRKAQRPVRAPPPVLDRNGDRHYHVEAIDGVRTRAGIRQLHAKWLGYPRSQSSWVDELVLRQDCADLVRACEQNYPVWFQ